MAQKKEMPKLWICIPVHNRLHLTLRCLGSLFRQDYPAFQVVLCDDGSTDGTAAEIRTRFPEVIVLSADGNLWWTGAINCCVRYVLEHSTSDGDAVLTLNNDLEVPPNYLSVLAATVARYQRAVIGSVGYDIETRCLVSPGYRQSWWTSKVTPVHPDLDHLPGDPVVVEVTHVPGRGTVIPVTVFREIGLYDERHLPHYGADYDYSHRARRAGYRIVVSAAARVYSHVSTTGMTVIRQYPLVRGLYRYLFDRRSPANLRARWWVAVRNCPRPLLPTFLLLDVAFLLGSYLKFHLVRRPSRCVGT